MSSNIPPSLGGKDTRGQVPPLMTRQVKVRSVHQDSVHIDVSVGAGSMQVPLLPGSRVPRAGDAALLLGDQTGAVALVLRTNLIYWNYVSTLPYLAPDKLTGPPCKLIAWTLESDVSGNLVVDVLWPNRAGDSICGSAPPTLAGQFINGAILTPEDGWLRNLNWDGQDVTLHFAPRADPTPTVTKYNICLIAEVR